jgi:AcrR family transcriptional regulator
VAVATELFGRHGFRGTTLRAIAERVGTSNPNVLHHFGTKHDLLMAVFDASFSDLPEPVPDAAGIDALWSLRSWGHWMEKHRDLAAISLILTAEHLQDRSVAHAYLRERYDALLQVISGRFAAATAAGDLRRDTDADAEAAAFVALVDGLRSQLFLAPHVPVGVIVESYVDNAMARLRR